MGKTFDTFAPMGPVIVTADEIEDPHKLAISLTLNGELMQNSNTSNLIFGVPQLIAFLSSVMTLQPGRHHFHRYTRGSGFRPEAAALAVAGRRSRHRGGRYRTPRQSGRGRSLASC